MLGTLVNIATLVALAYGLYSFLKDKNISREEIDALWKKWKSYLSAALIFPREYTRNIILLLFRLIYLTFGIAFSIFKFVWGVCVTILLVMIFFILDEDGKLSNDLKNDSELGSKLSEILAFFDKSNFEKVSEITEAFFPIIMLFSFVTYFTGKYYTLDTFFRKLSKLPDDFKKELTEERAKDKSE